MGADKGDEIVSGENREGGSQTYRKGKRALTENFIITCPHNGYDIFKSKG